MKINVKKSKENYIMWIEVAFLVLRIEEEYRFCSIDDRVKEVDKHLLEPKKIEKEKRCNRFFFLGC